MDLQLQIVNSTLSNKIMKENKRRLGINACFEEIYELTKGYGGTKPKQEKLLKLSLDEMTRLALELSSGPMFSGTLEGLETVHSYTISVIKTIDTDEREQSDRIKNYQQYFERQRLTCYGIPATSSEPTPGTSHESQMIDIVANGREDNKVIKKIREQCRRDRLCAGFDSLLIFIKKNGLWESDNKITKLDVLEIIIEYIKSKRAVIDSAKKSNDHCQGVIEGKKVAKEWATQYFTNVPQFETLEAYLESFLNPQPLLGFQLLQQMSMIPTIPNLMILPQMLGLQIPFPLTLPLAPVSPIGSLSPPPSSSSSSSSSSSPTMDKENDKEVKFFRPW